MQSLSKSQVLKDPNLLTQDDIEFLQENQCRQD